MRRNYCFAISAILVSLGIVGSVAADPIPGRDVLKFSQKPMINTVIPSPGAQEVFHGHDELSTAWGEPSPTAPTTFAGFFMADDFADKFTTPVVHVKWWGSYLNRPTSIPDPFVKRFLISFEEDVPATAAGGFSHPGEPLLNQIVALDGDGVLKPGEGTYTERIVPGSDSVDGPIFEYNAELHLDKAFPQKPDTVYWLKIVALVEASPNQPIEQRLQWGWHNRDYTIMDPLASRPPAVVPGEHIQGFLPAVGGDIPIWHFQDDAVSGLLTVVINPDMPIMPTVQQFEYQPKNYVPLIDGPSLIGQYSKDLAFELYTVPEPATLGLASLTLVAGAHYRRRRA